MISHTRPTIVYGKKGEQIEIISDRGNVLIVRGNSGRFPVQKSNVDTSGECENIQGERFVGCLPDNNNMHSNIGEKGNQVASVHKAVKRQGKAPSHELPSLF